MDEKISKAEAIYSEYRKVLLDRQQSNSERYDGALLSLSTGALGISLAFIKDIVPLDELSLKWLLILSWVLFASTVVLVLASYVTSQLGISRQLGDAEKYYLESNDRYLNRCNPYRWCTEVFNLLAGICFIVALSATIVFVSVNLSEAKNMTKETKKSVPTIDGAPIPRMQSVTRSEGLTKGAIIPNMQPVTPQNGNPPQNVPPPKDGK